MIPRAMLAVAYATGRASYARQVKGDDPDKKGYPGPPGRGFGVGLTTPHSKNLIVTKHPQGKKVIEYNTCVLILCTGFVKNISHPKTNSA
jgi:hypothetical protein